MMKSNFTHSAPSRLVGSSTRPDPREAGKPVESRAGNAQDQETSRLPLDGIGGSTMRDKLRKMSMHFTHTPERREDPRTMEKVGKLNLLRELWLKGQASEQDLPPIPAEVEELHFRPKLEAWLNVKIDRTAIQREFVRLKSINNDARDDAALWQDAVAIRGAITFPPLESDAYWTQFAMYKKMAKENGDGDLAATWKATRSATRNLLTGALQKVQRGEDLSRSSFSDNVRSAVRNMAPGFIKDRLDASEEARKERELEKKRQREWAGPEKGKVSPRNPDIGGLRFHHDDENDDDFSIPESPSFRPPRELSPSRSVQGEAQGLHPAGRISEEKLGFDVYDSMSKDDQENLDAILKMMDKNGKLDSFDFNSVPAQKRNTFINYMAGIGKLRAMRMSLQIEEVPREEAP